MRTPDGPGSDKPIQVFISWSHADTRPPKDANLPWHDLVQALAEQLSRTGFNIKCDIFEQGIDWTRWGVNMVDESDHTLMVFNKAYKGRWQGSNEPTEGAGSVREINALIGKFVSNQHVFFKHAIIVLLPGITEHDIPDDIQYLRRFKVDPIKEDGVEELVRELTIQPPYKLPERGKVPILPPRGPVTIERADGQHPGADPIGSNLAVMPSAVSYHEEIAPLIELFRNTGPPPDKGNVNPKLWIHRLGEWMDEAAYVLAEVDAIERVAFKGTSIRYAQHHHEARMCVAEIHGALANELPLDQLDELAIKAAQLWEQMDRILLLLLEYGVKAP